MDDECFDEMATVVSDANDDGAVPVGLNLREENSGCSRWGWQRLEERNFGSSLSIYRIMDSCWRLIRFTIVFKVFKERILFQS